MLIENYPFLEGKELIPFNRYIILEEVEENDKKEQDIDDNLICVPKEIKKKISKQELYKLFKIKNVAIDCNKNLKENGKNKYVIVDTTMIEEFVFGAKIYKIILENHIRGLFI